MLIILLFRLEIISYIIIRIGVIGNRGDMERLDIEFFSVNASIKIHSQAMVKI